MAKHKTTKKPEVTPMEFVGSQMANFLHHVAQDPSVPGEFRDYAKGLCMKWDSLSGLGFRLNPIVAAELDEKFFPKGTSA